jgi:hypothetical protein
MASEKGGKWAKDNLDHYNGKHFIKKDGTLELVSNVETITNLMLKHGLKRNNTYQDFKDYITFYPNDYFCPINTLTGVLEKTNNTATIHHFSGSWLNQNETIVKLKAMMPRWILFTYHKIVREWLNIKKTAPKQKAAKK